MGEELPVDYFTNFQRLMWYSLSQGAVSRFYIKRDDSGQYRIHKIKFLALSFYWIMWINTTIKVGYLLLSYHGWLGIQVHFLDQMSIWDWYLSTAHMIQEQVMWYPKYPMYENLYRQWDLQEDIFRKLGKPSKIAKKITATDKINIFYYPFVVFTGTFALSIQFFFTPKYALNTYAVVEADTWWLQIIFCLHECMFMYHAYAYQACTMVVAESYSVSFQHLLEELTITAKKLIVMGRPKSFRTKEGANREEQQLGIHKGQAGQGSVAQRNNYNMQRTELKAERTEKLAAEHLGKGKVGETVPTEETNILRRRIPYNYLNPSTKAPGTDYDILGLIHDYRRIMIAANNHNRWIGLIMGGAQAANYAQFVSDVFMLIQLLQEPDVDYFGLSFYVMDAMFGMCMLFRMMIVLSRMYPASKEFLHVLKVYATYDTPIRKYIVKSLPGLRIVGAKLTGYTVQPKSVPSAIHTLINYYIAAGMWKRPDDPSRRS